MGTYVFIEPTTLSIYCSCGAVWLSPSCIFPDWKIDPYHYIIYVFSPFLFFLLNLQICIEMQGALHTQNSFKAKDGSLQGFGGVRLGKFTDEGDVRASKPYPALIYFVNYPYFYGFSDKELIACGLCAYAMT